jgi:hypothetical protein
VIAPGARSRSARALAALAAILFGGYAGLLVNRRVSGVGGSDAAGYINTARDIAERRVARPIRGLAELGLDERWGPVFTPLAEEAGLVSGTMVPYYPPGFPIHQAAAASLAGWRSAPFLVSPIAAILCLALTYLLGRELGLSRSLASAGAAVLGAWVVFLYHAIEPLSDVPAALWSTAAAVAALRARRRAGWAAAAGASFGMAVLVRPTNVLLLPALALALPWHALELGLFAGAALPFAAFFGAWNRAAYGHPLRTGYTHQFASELAAANFLPRLGRYGSRLAMELSPLVPLGGIGVAWDRRVPARDRAMLVAWFGAIFLFYCFWGPSDNWTYGRYLLPAAPALVVGFLLVVRDWSVRIVRPARRAAAVAAAIVVVLSCERIAERRWRPLGAAEGAAVFPEGCRALSGGPGDRPTLGVSMEFSAALLYYTDAVPVRWDYLTPEKFLELRARAAERGWRIRAILFPHEVPQAIANVPGDWVFLGNVRKASLWELPDLPRPASAGMRR